MTDAQQYYVFVRGPYDWAYVGPFESYDEAKRFSVPGIFDLTVMSQTELDAHFDEFGTDEIISPDAYALDDEVGE